MINASNKYVRLICLVLLLLVGYLCEGQIPLINNQINISNHYLPKQKHIETWLSVNPINPKNFIGCSMVATADGNETEYSVIYATYDGGTNWVQGIIADSSSYRFPGYGDPMIIFDNKGTAYMSTLYKGITIWKSEDGGSNWVEYNRVPGSRAYDRQWMVTDSNLFYVYAKMPVKTLDPIKVAGKFWNDVDVLSLIKSSDYGKTFLDPVSYIPADLKTGYISFTNNFVITSKKTMLIAFSTLKPSDSLNLNFQLKVLRKEKTGKYESIDIHSLEWRSLNEVNKNNGTGVGSIIVSKANGNETIHITGIELKNGYYQVVTYYSKDDGKTWSGPIYVTDIKKQQFDMNNPGIAVNSEGVILISWFDRRKDKENTCFQLYGAFSFDDGKTFKKNFVIDSDFTCPCRNSTDGSKNNCYFMGGGDTQGIIALPDKSFQLLYSSGPDVSLKSVNIIIPAK